MAFNAKRLVLSQKKKQKGIVCSTSIHANAILGTNMLICKDEVVAYIGSVNKKPNLWTIHYHDSEWMQLDCPIAQEGIICKHTIKFLKMLHPNVKDGVIVEKMGTMHNVDWCTLVSHCYLTVPSHRKQLAHTTKQHRRAWNCGPWGQRTSHHWGDMTIAF